MHHEAEHQLIFFRRAVAPVSRIGLAKGSDLFDPLGELNVPGHRFSFEGCPRILLERGRHLNRERAFSLALASPAA
jgi:hypothetical protein